MKILSALMLVAVVGNVYGADYKTLKGASIKAFSVTTALPGTTKVVFQVVVDNQVEEEAGYIREYSWATGQRNYMLLSTLQTAFLKGEKVDVKLEYGFGKEHANKEHVMIDSVTLAIRQ